MLAALFYDALGEIAVEGPPGIAWPLLCRRLGACDAAETATRQALWQELLEEPQVRFRSADGLLLLPSTLPAAAPPAPAAQAAEGAPNRRLRRKTNVSEEVGGAEDGGGASLLIDMTNAARCDLLGLSPHPILVGTAMAVQALCAITRSRSQGCWAPLLARDLKVNQRDLFYQVEGLRQVGLVTSSPGRMSPEVLDRYRAVTKSAMQVLQSNLLFHIRYFDAEEFEESQLQNLFLTVAKAVEDQMLDMLERSQSLVVFEMDLRFIAKAATEQASSSPVSSREAGHVYQRVRLKLCEEKRVECVRKWDPIGGTLRDALCMYGAHQQEDLEIRPAPLALTDAPNLEEMEEHAHDEPEEREEHGHDEEPGEMEESERDEEPEETGESEHVEELEKMKDEHSKTPDESLECSGDTTTIRSWRVRERSLLDQCIDLIECSSQFSEGAGHAQGLTSPDIGNILGVRRKGIDRILTEAENTGQAVKVLESDGRTHINRYMSAAAAAALATARGAGRHDAVGIRRRPAAAAAAASAAAPTAASIDAGSVATSSSQKRSLRSDVTFERRMLRFKELLEARTAMSVFDFVKLTTADANLSHGTMDRKSAVRLLERLSASDARVKLSSTDGGTVQFAYWGPKVDAKAAAEMLEEEAQERHERRWQGAGDISRQRRMEAIGDNPDRPLAITDGLAAPEAGPSHVASISTLAVFIPSVRPTLLGAERRLLRDDIPVDCLRRDVGAGDTKPEQKLDQKIFNYYGFQAPVMVRAQLLHQSMLDSMGLVQEQGWTAALIVEDMDVQFFLQVLGCGVRNPVLDELLLRPGDSPKIRDLPRSARELMLNRTYGGSSRPQVAVRRLLAHLVKLKLVETVAEPLHKRQRLTVDGETPRVVIRYRLYQRVELQDFATQVQGQTPEPASAFNFDFADPLHYQSYWNALQSMCEAWMRLNTRQRRRGLAPRAEDGDEGSSSSGGDCESDESGQGKDGSADSVPAPANCPLPELLHKKNWKRKAWLTPQQRAALDLFYKDCLSGVIGGALAPAAVEAPSFETALVPHEQAHTRIIASRSLEVLALSEKTGVSSEQIVRYCKQKHDIANSCGEAGEAGLVAREGGSAVAFSLLTCVRYMCHLCAKTFFQSTAVKDHYRGSHAMHPPEDESLYCDADFLARRREELKQKVANGELQVSKFRRRRARRRKSMLSSEHGESSREEGGSRSRSRSRPHKRRGVPPCRPCATLLPSEDEDEASGGDDRKDPWGDDREDDADWIELFATAEKLDSCASGVRFCREGGGCSNTPTSTWAILARLTGRKASVCSRRVRSLLRSDKRNELAIRGLRYSYGREGFLTSQSHVPGRGGNRALGRALAKSLTLTPYREEEPWWRMDHFSQGVHTATEIAFRQMQLNAFVCKYKTKSHYDKLPEGSRPRYMLTTLARLRLFGQSEDLERLLEASQIVGEMRREGNGHLNPQDVSGSMVYAVAEMVSQNSIDLGLLWKGDDITLPQFGPKVQPSLAASELSDATCGASEEQLQAAASASGSEENVTEPGSELAPQLLEPSYGGIQAHLKTTRGGVVLDRISFKARHDPAADTTQMAEWLWVSEEEFEQVRTQDTVDPLLLEGLAPQGDQVEAEQTPSENYDSMSATACRDAFNKYVALAELGISARDVDSLLALAACLLRGVLGPSTPSGASVASAPPPGARLGAARQGALRRLAERHFRGEGEELGADGDEDIGASAAAPLSKEEEKCFNAAIACLEDLRFLVPVACGDEYCAVPAAAAAPFCLRRQGAAQPLDAPWEAVLRRDCVGGRHWSYSTTCAAVELVVLRGAAVCVARATARGCATFGLRGLILADNLIAPAPWVEGAGYVNIEVLRFVMLNLMVQLSSRPSTTAAAHAQETGLLDECEVALLLDGLIGAGRAKAEHRQGDYKPHPIVYSPAPLRPLHAL